MTYLEDQLLFHNEYRRAWFDQPSKLQRYHSLHGKEVYATEMGAKKGYHRIAYIEKPKFTGCPTMVISSSLSFGCKGN